MKLKKIIFFSISASLLSSLRINFLPEIEVLLLTFLFFLGNRFLFGAILVIILCSHHYVIPDAVLRFDSSDYPSIYTKKIGVVKIFDIIVILLFLFVLFKTRISRSYNFSFSKSYPYILLLFCLFGILITPFARQDLNLFFFSFRNVMIIISIYFLFSNFNFSELKLISYIAISSWISKMFFSILIPAENPLYRMIFGAEWNVYFAGDEYLSLGIYFISLLLLNELLKINNKNTISFINRLAFVSLILALISQRKGALIYFGLIFLIINFYNKKSLFFLINVIILVIPLSTFIFLFLILPMLPDQLSLLFFDQLGLLNSSIESLYHIQKTELFNFIFGIGPFSLYEIKGLDSIFDNSMAFGSEVGSNFRFMIWSLPFGRLFLNVGLFGGVIYLFYLVRNINKPPAYFYIYSSILGIFFFENISPVSALSFGFSFVIISNYNKFRLRNRINSKSNRILLDN